MTRDVIDAAPRRIDWPKELVDQLDWHWTTFVRRRLADLTDEEYRWEPVPGCWSVRPRAEAVGNRPAGAGDVVIDFAVPESSPAPLTTIAWRIGHLIGLFGIRASAHFGAGGTTYDTIGWHLDAAGALDQLDEAYAAWTAGVRSLGAEGLARPCGPAEGPFAESPLAALVLHLNREALHHGAEVLLMRDLYRTSRGGRSFTTTTGADA